MHGFQVTRLAIGTQAMRPSSGVDLTGGHFAGMEPAPGLMGRVALQR